MFSGTGEVDVDVDLDLDAYSACFRVHMTVPDLGWWPGWLAGC